MAEFRKREDITQEIDILQTWSEMGAPRMGDLGPNLQALMKSVEPELVRSPEPPQPARAAEPPRPVMPPIDAGEPPDLPPVPPSPFADLPPGDDEERPSRSPVLPLLALAVLGSVGLLYVISRWEPFTTANRPVPTPGGSGHGQRPTPGTKPSGAPVAQASSSAHASPAASASTSVAAVPSGVPSATASHAASASGAATPGLPATVKPGGKTPGSAHPAVIASARKPPPPVVREYRVKAGDSLSAIARDQLGNLDRWQEVYAANRDHIADPNLIQPGETLTLPGAPAAPLTYKAKPGDTLKAIAAAHLGHAARWREIYDLNRTQLSSPAVVPPGTVLTLPPDADGGSLAGRTPGLQTAAASHHTVRHGDSLSLLARRYLGSEARWPEIYYLNSHKIANPNWIFPGQRIAIPAPHQRTKLRYVVKSGDCLWAIAGRELGQPLRWKELYRVNRQQIRNPHWIYPGQILRFQ